MVASIYRKRTAAGLSESAIREQSRDVVERRLMQCGGITKKSAENRAVILGRNYNWKQVYDSFSNALLSNSGIVGMPVSYEIDGAQYIVVRSGWGVDAQCASGAPSEPRLSESKRVAGQCCVGVRGEGVTHSYSSARPSAVRKSGIA